MSPPTSMGVQSHMAASFHGPGFSFAPPGSRSIDLFSTFAFAVTGCDTDPSVDTRCQSCMRGTVFQSPDFTSSGTVDFCPMATCSAAFKEMEGAEVSGKRVAQ